MAYIIVTDDSGDEIATIGIDNTLTGEGGLPHAEQVFDGMRVTGEGSAGFNLNEWSKLDDAIEKALLEARERDLAAEAEEHSHGCCRPHGECDPSTP